MFSLRHLTTILRFRNNSLYFTSGTVILYRYRERYVDDFSTYNALTNKINIKRDISRNIFTTIELKWLNKKLESVRDTGK